jgi:hypothetical protein
VDKFLAHFHFSRSRFSYFSASDADSLLDVKTRQKGNSHFGVDFVYLIYLVLMDLPHRGGTPSPYNTSTLCCRCSIILSHSTCFRPYIEIRSLLGSYCLACTARLDLLSRHYVEAAMLLQRPPSCLEMQGERCSAAASWLNVMSSRLPIEPSRRQFTIRESSLSHESVFHDATAPGERFDFGRV